MPANNAVVRKFQQYCDLKADGIAVLDRLIMHRQRHIGANADIVREGEPPGSMRVVLSGWACRYKELPDGRRQTVGLLLPGDICDLNVGVLRAMDHTLGTLTPVTLAEITPSEFRSAMQECCSLEDAFFWEGLVNNAIQREWTFNLGARTAIERTAHIICELFERLRLVGMTEGEGFAFPLTQTALAETMGISAVHMNRVLQELRIGELIVLQGKTVTIKDLRRLQTLALFSPNYLHAGKGGEFSDRKGGS